MRVRRVAAIDIGSNSVRQVVADVGEDGSIRVVDEMKAAPRLGAGLNATGKLDDVAIGRTVEAVSRMASLAKQFGAKRIESVATSAVREASNGKELVDLIRERTGLRVRILSGSQEARLCFLSALAHFELGHGRAVVLDIGGGSLELALSVDGVVETLESFPFGAIRGTERFLDAGRDGGGVRALRKAVRRSLKEKIPGRGMGDAQHIGSGGTFTNLAGMYLARNNVRTARSIHGTYVPRAEVEHILEHLASLSMAERLAVPGLNAGRADIIVGGLAVAAEVLAYFGGRGLLTSAYGIREGLLLQIARVKPAISDPGRAREKSVAEFAQRCHYEEPHARQVRKLALRLFDSFGERIGCDPSDRQLLGEAALLHDVGYHISYNKHHKHSFHLIMHAEFLGMTPEDQIVIANVARYHRGSAPRKKHPEFGSLEKETRDQIRRLAAILRVADGLDRGHSGAVEKLRIRWTNDALRLSLMGSGASSSFRLEAWGACRKAGLLARLAGRPVIVSAPGEQMFSTAAEVESAGRAE